MVDRCVPADVTYHKIVYTMYNRQENGPLTGMQYFRNIPIYTYTDINILIHTCNYGDLIMFGNTK